MPRSTIIAQRRSRMMNQPPAPVSRVRQTVRPRLLPEHDAYNQSLRNRLPSRRIVSQPVTRIRSSTQRVPTTQRNRVIREVPERLRTRQPRQSTLVQDEYNDYDEQEPIDNQNENYTDYINRINENNELDDEEMDEYDDIDNNNDMVEEVPPGSAQPNPAMISKEIKERYQELIKDLWQNEQKLNAFDIPEDLKNALNDRVHLWLEYFLTNSTFRSGDNNMFEYLDTFNATTSFI